MDESDGLFPIEPWESIEELLLGITEAGWYLRLAKRDSIPVGQADPHIKPIMEVSQALFPTSVDHMPEDFIAEKVGWEHYTDSRLEDREGNEVKFPTRIAIERKYSVE